MNKKVKVYCIRRAHSYANWIPNKEFVNTIEECDLVVCPGGSDIDVRIYGETATHPACWGYTRMEKDDELADIKKAISLGKKLWGTCKGIQYGTAVSGGKLVQDIDHPYQHTVKTIEGKELIVNSMHHQMCNPFVLPKDEYKVFAWAENISPYHEDGNEQPVEMPMEPEIMYYPKTNFLGAQFHP